MYMPVLNAKAKARELVDIIREETNAPMAACIDTVSLILKCLMRDVSSCKDLLHIKTALDHEDIIDVEQCYDAGVIHKSIMIISSIIDDKKQQKWSLEGDNQLVECLQTFSSVLDNTDKRISINQLSKSDYEFIEKLVLLYQIEQNDVIRLALINAFLSCCQIEVIKSLLFSSRLPVLITANNRFIHPLSDLEIAAFNLLIDIYSITEKIPYFHLEYFTTDFFAKIILLCEHDAKLPVKFLLNFNSHFDDEQNFIISALHSNQSLVFGQLLIEEFNSRRNNDCDLDVLKMILDIFHAEPDLVKKTFYSNDLKVLCDILCQDLLDSDVKSRIMMILEVFERMIFLNCGVNLNATASALEILISSKEISPESKLFAERILQRCRCEE